MYHATHVRSLTEYSTEENELRNDPFLTEMIR